MPVRFIPTTLVPALESVEQVGGCVCAVLTAGGELTWGRLIDGIAVSAVLGVEDAQWIRDGRAAVFVARVGPHDQAYWVCASFEELAEPETATWEPLLLSVTRSAWDAYSRADEAQRVRMMFQSVLDTIPVRVFWKDLDGRYLGTNRLFAADAGRETPEELIGKNDHDMPWAPEADMYRADDRAVMLSGEAKVDYEEPQTTPSGETLWLQTSKIPLRDPEGRTFGVLGTYADITPRKQAEQSRERLLAELERKNLELERFTYTVSHDLKAPVVTIRGFAGLLKEELGACSDADLRASLEHAVSRIERAAGSMNDMLEELLEMSRAGNVLATPSPVSLRSLIDDALLLASAAIDESGATVRPGRPLPQVVVDGPRMVQVFQNLFENACKYRSPERPLILTIDVDDDGKVSVGDNGIGIPEAQRSVIFRPFRKLDPTSPGSGIGLSLVQRIIEAHGSRVEVGPGPDERGTTFSFQLDIATEGEA